MASGCTGLERWAVPNSISNLSANQTQENTLTITKQVEFRKPISRRLGILISALPFSLISRTTPSHARERHNRKTIPLEDYLTGPNGIKYYDIVEGNGPVAEKGSTDLSLIQAEDFNSGELNLPILLLVLLIFSCLAGNHIIAQPYEFKVGAPPGKEWKCDFIDNLNGLLSAEAAPKPPAAMSGKRGLLLFLQRPATAKKE